MVHTQGQATLKCSSHGRVRELATYRAWRMGGGVWVTALPGEVQGISFSPPEWQSLLRLRVGVLVAADGEACLVCRRRCGM